MHPVDINIAGYGIAALLIFAALRDIAARAVPNWVSVAILACGLALHAATGGLLAGSICGLIVFVCAALVWHRGWLGGADVKLLGAAAAAVSPASVVPLLLAVSLAGGVLALIYLLLSACVPKPSPGRPGCIPARLLKAETWRIRRRGPLPYAVAIAAGGLFTIFQS